MLIAPYIFFASSAFTSVNDGMQYPLLYASHIYLVNLGFYCMYRSWHWGRSLTMAGKDGNKSGASSESLLFDVISVVFLHLLLIVTFLFLSAYEFLQLVILKSRLICKGK